MWPQLGKMLGFAEHNILPPLVQLAELESLGEELEETEDDDVHEMKRKRKVVRLKKVLDMMLEVAPNNNSDNSSNCANNDKSDNNSRTPIGFRRN